MEQIVKFLATRRMNWKFITPRTPWEEGTYERIIGLMKQAMKRAIDKKRKLISSMGKRTNKFNNGNRRYA